MNQMILFPIMTRQHMQNLSTSTTLENLLNLTNLFPITSQHIQILTSPTTLANLQNLMTCLPYISCHYMQVLTAPTTLPEPGNPIPHHHQLAYADPDCPHHTGQLPEHGEPVPYHQAYFHGSQVARNWIVGVL